MTALDRNKTFKESHWKYRSFTLKSGKIAYEGAAACLELATAKVVPAANLPGLVFIGYFAEKVDASAADKPVNINLPEEIVLKWHVNATAGDAVAATDVMKIAYVLDDQTVTITPTPVVAGRIWAVDAVDGVAIQKLDNTSASGQQPAIAAYTANDSAPASLVNGGLYDVPTTGAASTITLPAAAPDGTTVHFAADGTKNGHTVTYRDATGPTNLTTALTASKRHLVIASKSGGKWFANAYVSP